MKYLIGFILLLALILAGIGFSIMCHGENHDSPALCVLQTAFDHENVSMVLGHISAYQAFSNAPFAAVFMLAMGLLALSLVLSGFLHKSLAFESKLGILRVEWRNPRRSRFHTEHSILRWLSLFEMSPTFVTN